MVLTSLGRVISLFGMCFVLIGFVHANALMYMVAVACFAILLGAVYLAWQGLGGLKCSRDVPGSPVSSGDAVEGRIGLLERAPRARLLEVNDTHTNLITGQVLRRNTTVLTETSAIPIATVAGKRQQVGRLGGERRIEIADSMRFPRRGHYQLGPLTVCSHDPFGLIRLTRTFPMRHEMIVFPRPLPLPEVMLTGGGGRQITEVRPLGRAGESADFHGIRPYVQGDDLRRVHWKATAHTGKLAIKEFEYRSSGAVQVILDLQAGIHHGEEDFSSLETAVLLAASVVGHVLGTGNQAGLLATSAQVVNLQPESGQSQLHRTLETLALARDDGTHPLEKTLASGETQVSSRGTIIVITPTVDRAIIGPLLSLRGRSAHLLLVLLNAHSFHQESEKAKAAQASVPWFAQPIEFRGLRTLAQGSPSLPTEEGHEQLLHAASAAGLEVYPVSARLPIHQALQGIHARMRI